MSYTQVKHHNMGGCTDRTCGVQEFHGPLHRQIHPRHVRGLNHGGVYDRKLDVLHANGADGPGWVLV